MAIHVQCSETHAEIIFRLFVEQNFHLKFLRLNFSRKKISFAPISFKLGPAYVSEDFKQLKQKISIIFLGKKNVLSESSENHFDPVHTPFRAPSPPPFPHPPGLERF